MTGNSYLDRRNKNKIGASGRKSETRLTKELNARGTPGSGNLAGAKGDARLGSFLIEMKSTQYESYNLTREVLAKIQAEALLQNKYPALVVSFVTGNGRPKPDGEWACVPMKQFKQFREWLEQEIEDQ